MMQFEVVYVWAFNVYYQMNQHVSPDCVPLQFGSGRFTGST